MNGTTGGSALLVLDIFNTFEFPGGAALFAQAKAGPIDQLRRLRRRFQDAGQPVVFVNDNFARWQDGFDELLAHVESSSEHGRAMVRALRPDGDDLKLLKPRHSAFFETALPSLLYHVSVKRIVVTGLAADSCVLCTVLDAYVRGIDAIVPSDTTASQTAERTERTLAHLRETCGITTPTSAEVTP
jgi:nicotinamidase-related amidase